MSNCLTPEEIEQYAGGRISGAERERVRKHLAACGQCKAELSAVQSDHVFLAATESALRALDRTDETEGLDRSMPAEHLPRIEGYDITRLIGRGGMAAVYEAVQKKLNRRVALKLLPAVAGAAQPSLVTRFHREAAAAAKLHHTNIVPIYDFGESRDGYFYAMELIRGLSLRDMIKRLSGAGAPDISAAELAALVQTEHPGLADEVGSSAGSDSGSGSSAGTGSTSSAKGRPYYRQVARWMADVADALHFAHNNGIIHRDIKPGNLIISTDRRIMVADFGLAKSTGDDSVTISGSLIGTYRYMSPEQVGAKRVLIDARTDVYSLGATLYEMLTFQPVFSADDRQQLLGDIMFREPTQPRKIIPSIPAELQTICLKAMEKSPDARYKTSHELAEDLRRYIGDLPIAARPPSTAHRLLKFVRRHDRETIAALVVLVLVIGALTGRMVWNHRLAKQRIQEARVRFAAKDYEGTKTSIFDAIALDERWRDDQDAMRMFEVATAEGPRYWNASIKDDPQVGILLTQGAAQLASHKLEVAESTFRKVLDANPNDFRALANLGIVKKELYYQTGDESQIDQAESYWRQALKIRPDTYQIHDFIGVAERARGRFDEAEEAHRETVKAKPDYYPAHVNLGIALAKQGKFRDAAQSLRKGIDLCESGGSGYCALARRNLGALLLVDGAQESQQLLGNLDEWIRKHELTDVTTLLLRSRVHQLVSGSVDKESALQFARAANSAAGEDATGRVKRILALAELRNEHWDKAATAAGTALALQDDPIAYANLVLAISQCHLGDKQAGRARLQAATENWPDWVGDPGYLVADDQDKSLIWIETAAELQALRKEAEQVCEAGESEP